MILLCFLLLSLAAVWSWITGDAYASAGNFFASFYTLAFGGLLVALSILYSGAVGKTVAT